MYHYSFTNDIRIEKIDKVMQNIANQYLVNKIPSADDSKSTNNVANTLGFYFNFRNMGTCTKYASEGKYKLVLLNFVKKFQYPNPRAKESGIYVVNDKIQLAPLRSILRLLYVFYLNDGINGYLTQEEITDFIFFNEKVAKSKNIDYVQLYNDIIAYRKTGDKPNYIAREEDRLWKGHDVYIKKRLEYENGLLSSPPSTDPEKRQIGILLSLMKLSECILYDTNGKYKFNSSITDNELKQYIYEILTYNEFWIYDVNVNNSENEKSYYDYMEIKEDYNSIFPITFNTTLNSKYDYNRIIFGAPGTGKSHKLKIDCDNLLNNTTGSYERVTFHPDYSYSHFVGTYKPITDDSNSDIKYEFVPGPFIRIYIEALRSAQTDNPQPYILLIEEINRAKVAAVFGDIFQLLDRDDNGVSEYSIHTNEDVKKYLAKELNGSVEDFREMKLPNNLFIWATMNSADQGVFPMDTAFKRRWNFEYLDINKNDTNINGKIILGTDSHKMEIQWNKLRKAINDILACKYKVNEDKLLGPYFLSPKVIATDSETDYITDSKKFIQAFKNKILMYLYEDAAKMHRHKLFAGCNKNGYTSTKFSSICSAFDTLGIDIFEEDFRTIYNKQKDAN